YPSAARPVREIRVAISVLSAERDGLRGHPVESKRRIRGFERIAGVLREVRRAADGVGAIDGWQENEVASGVIHLAASHRQAIRVFLEPEAVVHHETDKGLLAAGGCIVMTIRVVNHRLSLRSNACYLGAAIFASQVSGKREGYLVEKVLRPVVVFDFNAVVGVDAGAGKLAIAIAQRVFTHAVIVEDQGEPGLRTPQNLASQTWLAADPPVGLPAIDDPGLDLQLVRGKPLDADAVE